MSVLDMRDAIVTRVAATLPMVQKVAPHGGDFTLAELERHRGKTPAVFIVCLGLAAIENQGGVAARRYQWGAFIVTTDIPAKVSPPAAAIPKADLALRIADEIAKLVAVDTTLWDGTAGETCDESTIRSRNLYSAAVDAQGVTLWAVTWNQMPDTSDDHDFDALDDLLRFHTKFEISKPKGDPDAPDYVPDSELRTEVPGP